MSLYNHRYTVDLGRRWPNHADASTSTSDEIGRITARPYRRLRPQHNHKPGFDPDPYSKSTTASPKPKPRSQQTETQTWVRILTSTSEARWTSTAARLKAGCASSSSRSAYASVSSTYPDHGLWLWSVQSPGRCWGFGMGWRRGSGWGAHQQDSRGNLQMSHVQSGQPYGKHIIVSG